MDLRVIISAPTGLHAPKLCIQTFNNIPIILNVFLDFETHFEFLTKWPFWRVEIEVCRADKPLNTGTSEIKRIPFNRLKYKAPHEKIAINSKSNQVPQKWTD